MPGDPDQNPPAGPSPSGPNWLPEPDAPFWKPPRSQVYEQFGWRWLFLIIALVPGIGCALLLHRYSDSVFVWIPFLMCIVISLPIAESYATKTVLRKIPGPFCIHCGYTLQGLSDFRSCPECGRPFSFRLIDQFRENPHDVIDRCRDQSRSKTHT